MHRFALLVAAGLLAAGPALAQGDAGNAGQPSRTVPQTGQTTGGPLVNPAMPDRPMEPGLAAPAPDTTGTLDTSAKGGNAAEPNKPAPHLGGTSGGPAR